MVRFIGIGVVLLLVSFVITRELRRIDFSPRPAAESGGAADSARSAGSPLIGDAQRRTLQRAPALEARASLRAGEAPIDISGLSEIDMAILKAGTVADAQVAFLARHAVGRTVRPWVLRAQRSCTKNQPEGPTMLEANVTVRMSGGRAEVVGLDSVSVAKGAPIEARSAGCIEARMRAELPLAIKDSFAGRATFHGRGTFLVQVGETQDCRDCSLE